MQLPNEEPAPMEVIFEDEATELDKYDQDDLSRVSKTAKKTYEQVQMDTDKQLNFQEKLHLDVQVERARDLIFQCNLELADFMSIIANDNHLEGLDKKKDAQEPSESPTLLSKASSDPGVWYKLLITTLQNFKKTFTLRQVQLTMILFIIQHRNGKNFKQLYLKNYGMLPSYIVPVELTSSPINIFILDDLFRKEAEYLKIYLEQILLLKKHSTYEKVEQINQIVGRMKVSHSKIKTIGEIFPWACIKDKGDLFSQPPIDERWQRLTSTGEIKYISLADHHTLTQSFSSLKDNLTIVNAAMSVLDKNKKHLSKPLTESMSYIMRTAYQVIKVGLIKSEAVKQASIMMAEPEEKLAKQIWNLPQNKRFKMFIQLSLPSIEYSEIFYLPRVLKQYFTERYKNKKDMEMPNMYVENRKAYLQKMKQKQSYDQTIRIRINCPYQLKVRGDTTNVQQQEANKRSSTQGTYQYLMKNFGISSFFQKKQKAPPKAVIFHIHGGGFISMSSFIHQIYTRPWASKLQVPIVSVDYGKAPEKPFPNGLYDCLQAYMWTLLVFRQIYDMNPEQIIIVGDSAGGNLTAALCTLLIEWDLPRPSGLVLVYPALNLNFNTYTPSLLTALNDMILPHTFLKLCLKAYIKDSQYDPEEDPFISPILTSSEVLQKYPKTEILVGNKDPFHDDCCRFLEALNVAKKDNAKLIVFQEFPHGFLQFDLKFFPNQYAREATKHVEQAIGFLLAR